MSIDPTAAVKLVELLLNKEKSPLKDFTAYYDEDYGAVQDVYEQLHNYILTQEVDKSVLEYLYNQETNDWGRAAIYAVAVNNPHFDHGRIWDFIRNKPESARLVREAVAKSKYVLPLDIIQILINDQEMTIKAGVAANPNTPPDILEKLYQQHKDRSGGLVIMALLRNPNTNPGVATELSFSKNESVRNMAAKWLKQYCK